MNHKAGYVSILGLPNSGKSTLMNSLIGQKLSIITNKPQTTRKRILGILSEKDFQIIFLDNPGILKPGYLLQEKMMEAVSQSVKDADIFLFILDINSDPDGNKILNEDSVKEILNRNKKPKILVINKIDLSSQEFVQNLIEKIQNKYDFIKIIPMSASLGFNTGEVISTIVDYLPESPSFYPDDIVADENERFFVSEIIREKILELYQEEIPYSIEVLIADYKEREDNKDYIGAEIVVEKDSQKGIIIGKNGAAIKKLGLISRKAVEDFLEKEVYLDLRVKVRKKWRSNENLLKSFGYSKGKE
ncbi:MAG: GTPase Era [Ignavibacteriaceae bacterium]